MKEFLQLLHNLKKEERVFIQTHNFPDHDAVASAFGLQELMKSFGVQAHILYKGELQRESLRKMVEELHIQINKYEQFDLSPNDKIIVVDGCKGNSNVDDLIGEEVGVIDHHDTLAPEDVSYVDIRSSYGSCSTIIYTYFRELGVTMSKNVATALIIGLNMDTAQLSRGVSEEDVNAFPALYVDANMTLVNSLLRNYIQTKDLDFYKYLLNEIIIENGIAFCYFNQGCNQNLLGILGDFILSLEEVEFVILCALNGAVINFSLRNEFKGVSAAAVVQKVLHSIGFGGGHADMAGGVIKDLVKFDENTIRKQFFDEVKGAVAAI